MQISSLSLDQMRAALAVAETGSFSAAARRLSRKQSALSYAVAGLERQLGVLLFERSDGQPPTTTDVGRLLLREMEVVVRRAYEIENQARDIGKGIESELTITIDSMFPLDRLHGILKDFSRQFSSTRIRLNVEAMGAVQTDVLAGRSTLGIVLSLINLSPGLIGDALTSVVRLPVAASDHPLAQGNPGNRVPHRVILDHIQIVQHDRSELTKGRDFNVYAVRTWRVSDLAVKRSLLCAGLGWGYMPEPYIAAELDAGILVRIWVEDLRDQNMVPLSVVRRRDKVLGPAARWLLARLAETTANASSSSS